MTLAPSFVHIELCSDCVVGRSFGELHQSLTATLSNDPAVEVLLGIILFEGIHASNQEIFLRQDASEGLSLIFRPLLKQRAVLEVDSVFVGQIMNDSLT